MKLSAFLTLFIALDIEAEEISRTPSKDNTLFGNEAGLSSGLGIFLFAGNTNGGETRRALLAFDLSSNVPAGSIIESAELSLSVSKASTVSLQTFRLHRLLVDWGEGPSDASENRGAGVGAEAGDATWVHNFDDTSDWTSPGGDFPPAASANREIGGVGTYTWDSTLELVADVQSWLDEPGTNFGWILLGNEIEMATTRQFHSREAGESGLRSILRIVYTLDPATALEASVWSDVKRKRDQR